MRNMSGFVCGSFQEHAFRREICANCRKTKLAHRPPQPAKRNSVARSSEERDPSPSDTKKKESADAKDVNSAGAKSSGRQLKRGSSVDNIDGKLDKTPDDVKPTLRASKPRVPRKALSVDVSQKVADSILDKNSSSPPGSKGKSCKSPPRPQVPPPEAPKPSPLLIGSGHRSNIADKEQKDANNKVVDKNKTQKSDSSATPGSHYYHKYDVSARGKTKCDAKVKDNEVPPSAAVAVPYTVVDVSKSPPDKESGKDKLPPKLPSCPSPPSQNVTSVLRNKPAPKSAKIDQFSSSVTTTKSGKDSGATQKSQNALSDLEKSKLSDEKVGSSTKPPVSVRQVSIIVQSDEKRLSQDNAYEPVEVDKKFESKSSTHQGSPKTIIKDSAHEAKMAFLAGVSTESKKVQDGHKETSHGTEAIEKEETEELEKHDKSKRGGKSFFAKLLRRGSTGSASKSEGGPGSPTSDEVNQIVAESSVGSSVELPPHRGIRDRVSLILEGREALARKKESASELALNKSPSSDHLKSSAVSVQNLSKSDKLSDSGVFPKRDSSAKLPIDKKLIQHSNPNLNSVPPTLEPPPMEISQRSDPSDITKPLEIITDQLPPPKPKRLGQVKKPPIAPPNVPPPGVPFGALSAPGISPTVATLPEAPKRPGEEETASQGSGLSAESVSDKAGESDGKQLCSTTSGDSGATPEDSGDGVAFRRNSKARKSDSRLSNVPKMAIPPPPPPPTPPVHPPEPPVPVKKSELTSATLPRSPIKRLKGSKKEQKSPETSSPKVKSPKTNGKKKIRSLEISGPISVTPMCGGIPMEFSMDDMCAAPTIPVSKDDAPVPKKRFDSKKKHNRNRTVTEGIDIDIESLIEDDDQGDQKEQQTGRFVNRALPPPPEDNKPTINVIQPNFENVYEFVPSDPGKAVVRISQGFDQRQCYEDIDDTYDTPSELLAGSGGSSTTSSVSHHSLSTLSDNTMSHSQSNDYLEPISAKEERKKKDSTYPDIIPTSALKKTPAVKVQEDLTVSSSLQVPPRSKGSNNRMSQHYVMPYVNVEMAFDMDRPVLTTADGYKKMCALHMESLQQKGEEIFSKYIFPEGKFDEKLKWRDFSIGANGIELSLGLLGFYKARCYKVRRKECYLMVSGKSLPKELLEQCHVNVLCPTTMFRDKISADYFPQPRGLDPKVYQLFGVEQTNIAVLGYNSVDSLTNYIQETHRKLKSSSAEFERNACYIMSHILNGLLFLYERNLQVAKLHSNEILVVEVQKDEKYCVVNVTSPAKDLLGQDNQLFDSVIALIFQVMKLRWNKKEDPYTVIPVKSKYSQAFRKLVALLYQKQFTLQSLIMARNILEYILWGPDEQEAKVFKESKNLEEAHAVWLEVGRCKLINQMALGNAEAEGNLARASRIRFLCSMTGSALADTAKIIDINV